MSVFVSVFVSSGQTYNVSSGQTDIDDTVDPGGTLNVLSGGRISNTLDNTKESTMTEMRKETDSLGVVEVPADKLDGVEKGAPKPAPSAAEPVAPHEAAERRQVTVVFSDLD
jgi:autotransporter passenger strand-loop-strand repeat protein